MYLSTLPAIQNHHGSALKRQAETARVLSTGKRITQFGDDAAGAAVAATLNMRATGLEVAQRNVAEALSMATMTDAGLAHIDRILVRVREIAIQAANGTYTDADRSLMQMELEHSINEINRFAETYKWNDNAVLAGRTLGLNGIRYDTYFNDNMANLSGAPVTGNIELDTLSPSLVGPDNQTATWVYTGYFVPDQTGTWQFRTTSDDASYIWIGSDALLADTSNNVSTALVSNPGLHGMRASAPGSINLVSGTSYPIKVVVGNNQGPMGLNIEYRFGTSGNFISDIGRMQTQDDDTTVQAGEDQHDAVDMKLTALALASSLGLSGQSVETTQDALSVIPVLDAAMLKLADKRATVGASVNRLLSQQENLYLEYLAMQDTTSRIEDVNMAEAAVESAQAILTTETGAKAIRAALDFNRSRIAVLIK